MALLGPNGSGKTTFLKTVLGQLEPLQGYARLGASLKLGYFAQVHCRPEARGERTRHHPGRPRTCRWAKRATFLARFLFTGDDVFKPIGDLSGGERSRVALARLVLQRANFLLLDEPTNHLDIPSQEILEAVLDDFAGTILLVTHDRYLVDRLATQLWIINTKTRALDVFRGTWAEYVALREREARTPEARQAKDKWSQEQRQARREEKRSRREEEARREQLQEVESEIHSLEEQLKALQTQIEAASQAQEAMRLVELGALYGELESQLQAQMDRWAELAG